LFERELVEACTVRGLSRVVRAFEGGDLRVEGIGPPIPYIVFELADGDVRRALDKFTQASLAARLRLCHEATVAVRQLHIVGIAHQDVKPSNVMVFEAVGAAIGSSKIGDLGRASERGKDAEHDRFIVAGDRGYAPPEQLYGVARDSFDERRLACDLFQLGSLCAFILSQAPLNLRMARHLHPSHAPGNWGDDYEAALPFVRSAHRAAIEDIETDLGPGVGAKAATLIGYLTDPDPLLRGHPSERGHNSRYALQKFVSGWNQLAAEAELAFLRSAK
jgi:serine/threonine protein kinase